MAIIAQASLFSWEDIESSPDILRLARVIELMPDEPLMRALEQERKGRRDDYPLRAMWNALLGAIVFGHVSIASLLRELRRNGELRGLCGFAPGAHPDGLLSLFAETAQASPADRGHGR